MPDKGVILVTFANNSANKYLTTLASTYEPRYTSLYRNSPDGMFCSNLDGQIIDANPALQQLVGKSLSVLVNSNVADLLDKRCIAEFNKTIDYVRNGITKQLTIDLVDAEGQLLHVKLSLMPIQIGDNVIGFHGILMDITDFWSHDQLTKLPKRDVFLRLLKEKLEHIDLSYEFIAVLYIDLDRFRIVNESRGHLFGDKVILNLCQRLQQSLTTNELLCRVVGDEFAIVLHRSNKPELDRYIDQLQALISEPFIIDGFSTSVSASIGVSTASHTLSDANKLLRYAEIAMTYAKKHRRKTIYYYSHGLGSSALRKIELESNFHEALDESQFLIYYQPQIDLDLNRVVGVEALVRWSHPQFGMISPIDFIPIAEESGFIIPLGEWILSAACRQFRTWLEQGSALTRLSVNISVTQLEQENFCEQVLSILESTGLDPGYLELEITESQMLNLDSTISKIRSLRDRGIKIAIDDFGTGYSPLSSLRQIAIDTLKIDKGFIREICENAQDLVIVQTIIHMAQMMKLNLIAEGVETSEQLVLLGANRLREVQGYYFSPPVPHTEVEKLIFLN